MCVAYTRTRFVAYLGGPYIDSWQVFAEGLLFSPLVTFLSGFFKQLSIQLFKLFGLLLCLFLLAWLLFQGQDYKKTLKTLLCLSAQDGFDFGLSNARNLKKRDQQRNDIGD